MKPAKNLNLSLQPSKQSEFEKDIWDGRKLGADIRPRGRITIDFGVISQPWLRQAAKQYVKYSFATLSWATCRNKKTALGDLSSFLAEYHLGGQASDVNRLLIINFLAHLVSKKLGNKTRLSIIVDLNTFLHFALRTAGQM